MWKKLPKPFRFILIFFVISGILLILWKIISILYLYLLVAIASPIWNFCDYPVQMVIRDHILHFIYRALNQEPLTFIVYKVDEIYLNLVLVLALFGATWLTLKKKILCSFIFSLGILFVIHELVLYAYSYTHIWEFAHNLDPNLQKKFITIISHLFSKTAANFLNHFLSHWNAWGWDVIPLILWLGGIYKFILSRIPSVK